VHVFECEGVGGVACPEQRLKPSARALGRAFCGQSYDWIVCLVELVLRRRLSSGAKGKFCLRVADRFQLGSRIGLRWQER